MRRCCRVEWSPDAINDMAEIFVFLLEGRSDTVAQRARAAIEAAVSDLEALPARGHPVDIDLRELLVPFGSAGYAVLYALSEDEATAQVLHVKHYREAGY